jgi:hypothetical protein
MFKTNNINDLELLYSILREKHPNNQIEITFNYNKKEYLIKVTSKKFKNDPEVPVDINIEIVYGDSVTGDTPLLLRNPLSKLVSIKTIDSLCNENSWNEYPEFKIMDTDTDTNISCRTNKQYGLTDYEVWSDSGWNPIKKVIRHKTNKKIYRITTQTGCVDVTEDHSLCSKNLEKLSPKDINDINDITINNNIELLHSFPNKFNNCKPIREINFENTDINEDKHVILLNKFSDYLLNCSKDIKEKFCKTFYKKTFFSFNSKLECAIMYYLLRNLNNDVNVGNYENTFNLQLSIPDPFKENKIKKIEFLRNTNHEEFVYDLETENGRFNAGIGQLVVYNTDSIFCKFNYNRNDFEKNRQDTFKLAEICGEKLTDEIFDRPPIVLEFEKVFHPFILLTKKRYIANKFEDMKDPFKLKGIDAKGIALTRRDYCKMVKNCYQNIIDTIMKIESYQNFEDNLEKSINIYKKYVEQIQNYEIPTEDLVVSAMLAKSYKTKPVHVNLAEKLKERKEEVSIGDRIPYIYIESNDPKKQKSELGEDPKYAKDNNLKFNRTCYLEQLGKPILSFFKVILKEKPEVLEELINYTNKKLELFGGKKFKLSDFKIED